MATFVHNAKVFALAAAFTLSYQLQTAEASLPRLHEHSTAAAGASLPFTDAISREISVYVEPPQPAITDAASREVSVLGYTGPHPMLADAASREVSVFTAYPQVHQTDIASREVSIFSIIPITLGTPYNSTLPPGTWLYFSVTTPPDLTLRIDLNHGSNTAWTELYASFGTVPDTLNAQFASQSPGKPDQELIVPNTQAGTYYILARCTTDGNASASKSFTITATGLAFGLFAATPTSVGAGKEVSLSIVGARLDDLADVYLRFPSSGAQIRPVQQRRIDPAHRDLRFDLSGAALGVYDLVVQSTTLSTAALLLSITVGSPVEAELSLDVTPSPFIRSGHGRNTGRTRITLTNPSNVDVPLTVLTVFAKNGPDMNLTIEGSEEIALIGNEEWVAGQVLYESIWPGQRMDVSVRIDVGPGFPGPNVQVYAYTETYTRQAFRDIWIVGPGGPVDKLAHAFASQNNVPASYWTEFVPAFKLNVALYFDQHGIDLGQDLREATLRLAPDGRGGLPSYVCDFVCGVIERACPNDSICPAIDAYCNTCFCDNPCAPICLSYQLGLCPPRPPDEGCQPPCGGDPLCPPACVCRPKCLPATDGVYYSENCRQVCLCSAAICTPGGRSTDPNEKNGPLGFGASHFTASGVPLGYRVLFENLPQATAPASEITVTDILDPAIDLATVRLHSIGFGQTVLDLPSGHSSLQAVVDIQESLGLLVDVCAQVDSSTRTLRFSLTALDPQTGQLPMNPLLGFLPPNDDTGRGEGYVEFSAAPASNAQSGAVVRNNATIVFDYNAPIVTNEVFNTIDAAAPSSAVEALPSQVYHRRFNVCWMGRDDVAGSGIMHYSLFSSDNAHSYGPWLTSGAAGCAAFNGGAVGHTYRFYSMAEDNVGNAEAAPTSPQSASIIPDATTTVRFGDFNGDGIVDSSDYFLTGQATLWSCFTIPKGDLSPQCVTKDVDFDGDVDLRDFATFQNGFSGLQHYRQLFSCFTAPDPGVPFSCHAQDFEPDGDVDLKDFAVFQIVFGTQQ